jgi:hypothetical protein
VACAWPLEGGCAQPLWARNRSTPVVPDTEAGAELFSTRCCPGTSGNALGLIVALAQPWPRPDTPPVPANLPFIRSWGNSQTLAMAPACCAAAGCPPGPWPGSRRQARRGARDARARRDRGSLATSFSPSVLARQVTAFDATPARCFAGDKLLRDGALDRPTFGPVVLVGFALRRSEELRTATAIKT